MAGIKRAHWSSWRKKGSSAASKANKKAKVRAAIAIVKRAAKHVNTKTKTKMLPKRKKTKPTRIPKYMSIGATPGAFSNMRENCQITFKYCDSNFINEAIVPVGSGVPSTEWFALDLASLYDPYVPSGGHQPRGFDQWCGDTKYRYYRVDSAVVEFEFFPQYTSAATGYYQTPVSGQIRFCNQTFDQSETIVNNLLLARASAASGAYDQYEEYDFSNTSFEAKRIVVKSTDRPKSYKKKIYYDFQKERRNLHLKDYDLSNQPAYTKEGFTLYNASPEFKNRVFVNVLNTGNAQSSVYGPFQGVLKYTITYKVTLKNWNGAQTPVGPS